MSMTENITIISNLDKLCRTCLAEKNIEELRPVFVDSVDAQIMDITSVKVITNASDKNTNVDYITNFRSS